TLSLDLGATNIYGLVLQPLCEVPITCEVTPLSNPGQPVIINSEGTGVNGVLSAGTSLENVQNVISQDETDFATVTLVAGAAETISIRSEEHTSELQSRENLVCRLLLEKK